MALGHLSQLLWVVGYPERACRAADEASSGAERQEGKFDLIAGMHYGLFTRLLRREHRAVLQGAEMAAALAREHGVGAFVLVTEVLGHWARLTLSKRGEDIDPFVDSINAKRSNGDERITALHLGALAEALAANGRVEDALATIAEALELTERTGERWSEAELHRLGGQILLMRDGLDTTGEAEARFRRSLDIGRRQSGVGTANRDQSRPTVARSGQARRGPRPPRARVRLVHGGLGHSGSDRGEGAARRAALRSLDHHPTQAAASWAAIFFAQTRFLP